jgi:hypothetical protein
LCTDAATIPARLVAVACAVGRPATAVTCAAWRSTLRQFDDGPTEEVCSARIVDAETGLGGEAHVAEIAR